MGCSKHSSKKEVYSKTILPKETRKTFNRLPNFTPKTSGQRRTEKPKISRRKEIIKFRGEIIEKEMKETIVKINKTKSCFFEKINKIVKSLSGLIKRKREENQSKKVEMKKKRSQETMHKCKAL